ncbi:hypothetical protein BS640_19995 [Rouxiella badensis]|uniref:Uncharacterized protein n=1 Tax=Rouxiella badensis TaxID=1646377 RepID=A0A1X0WAC2_9GAMM|nr:hypothetical protein BS640_19995 [Rouxiella badensis]
MSIQLSENLIDSGLIGIFSLIMESQSRSVYVSQNFTEEFKIEAVKQINKQGYLFLRLRYDSAFPPIAITQRSILTKNPNLSRAEW